MSFAGTDLEYARSYNRRVVLGAEPLYGSLHRAEIARLTSLTQRTLDTINRSLSPVLKPFAASLLLRN